LVIFSCIAYVARLREEAQEPGYSNSQKLWLVFTKTTQLWLIYSFNEGFIRNIL
jgi:hypothetical protein